MRSVLIALLALLGAPLANARVLSISSGRFPDVNCRFSAACRISVSDRLSEFSIPGASGAGRVQSRTAGPGEAGTPGDGLSFYLYRIDLTRSIALTARQCVTSVSLDFGDIRPLDYDGDGVAEDVTVVTHNGAGSIPATVARAENGTVTLEFSDPICPGLHAGGGGSSFFIGLASERGPGAATATLGGMPPSAASVSIASPILSKAVAYGIDEFTSADCHENPLTSCVAVAQKFHDRLATHSSDGWLVRESILNSDVRSSEWTDRLRHEWGADDQLLADRYGADSVNVALLCSHGGVSVDEAFGFGSIFKMGWFELGSEEECLPQTDTNLVLGNGPTGHLEVAIMATCESAQKAVWDATIGMPAPSGTIDFTKGYGLMVKPEGNFTTWLGFHGHEIDNQAGFEEYFDTAYASGLGGDWLESLRTVPGRGGQCPVAIVFCADSSYADCDDQYLDGGLNNRHLVAPGAVKDKGTYYYLAGCHPPHPSDPVLPNP